MGYRGEETYKDIGRKIRVFRNLKGLSQLSLEVAIGASNGVISRIESGGTNPSKETLIKIIKTLKLNNFEADYLIGDTAYPATQDEIDLVREQIKDYFSKPFTFAYIVDDRERMIAMSDAFIRLAKWDKKDMDKILMQYMPIIATDDSIPIKRYLTNEDYELTLQNVFSHCYTETHFMIGDECYEDMIKKINNNDLAKKYWDLYTSKEIPAHSPWESRTITFRAYGVNFKMTYSLESYWFNQKFRIVEYIPTNTALKLLKKITSI